MKKKLLIAISAWVLLILLAQIDDDLSTDAINLANKVEVASESESEAFLYLAGIYAAADENPNDIGRHLLEQHEKADIDDLYEIVDYPKSKRIALPDGDIFCDTWGDSNCLKTLFTTDYNIEKLLEENSTLISRSIVFHNFNEYKTLTKPSIDRHFLSYQYLAKADRINVLNAISTYKKGNAEEAIATLREQLKKSRKLLSLQDELIDKMVSLTKLSELIDVSSIMLSETGFIVAAIPKLNPSEKNFEMISAREFWQSYSIYKKLDRHPEFLQIGGNVPGWISRTVYKPNMTINAITPIYYRLNRIAKLTPEQFAKEIKLEDGNTASSSKLRNYVGEMLIGVEQSYDPYVANFMDFDAKIKIFNQLYHYQDDITNTENPYGDGSAPEVSENKICFQGPLEDKRFIRCLRTKI